MDITTRSKLVRLLIEEYVKTVIFEDKSNLSDRKLQKLMKNNFSFKVKVKNGRLHITQEDGTITELKYEIKINGKKYE